jgi:hypothetical protein
LNATVTGAFIAGGFAVVGFGASAIATAATLRANRIAAQDQRLWEKRAPMYEQIIGAAKSVADSANGGEFTGTFNVAQATGAAQYDPSAVQVLRDHEAQVWTYSSFSVSVGHAVLLRRLMPVPSAAQEVFEAATSLIDLVRTELQPDTPQRVRRLRRVRDWLDRRAKRGTGG